MPQRGFFSFIDQYTLCSGYMVNVGTSKNLPYTQNDHISGKWITKLSEN